MKAITDAFNQNISESLRHKYLYRTHSEQQHIDFKVYFSFLLQCYVGYIGITYYVQYYKTLVPLDIPAASPQVALSVLLCEQTSRPPRAEALATHNGGSEGTN